jgi:hypothetical protein
MDDVGQLAGFAGVAILVEILHLAAMLAGDTRRGRTKRDPGLAPPDAARSGHLKT